MTYAGFPPRALALIVDSVIWIPVDVLFHHLFADRSDTLAFGSYLLLGVLFYVYPVFFHAQWGQTLGKMLAHIRVTGLGGEPIGYRKAVLRSLVDILLWSIFMSGAVYMFVYWEDFQWSSQSYMELNRLVREGNPAGTLWYYLAVIWTLSEMIVLLFNEKRRAFHDFIAGTVVIHTESGKRGQHRSVRF